jgi:putative type I restriction-modification enzyme, S subunit (fragment)
MYCGKFKDVFPFIKNGANIKQDVNAGGIPITRIETLAGGEFNTSRLGYANIFDISPYYEYVLNSGDILMSHINSPAYLGRAVVFEDKYDIVIHGMNLLRLKANKELIDSRYAVYLFSGNIFKEHIRKITKKSVNQASFSINDLKEIEIQLPSIENQVIIAEKLDKLKMLIKKKNRLILFLDEMIKSRFDELIIGDKCDRLMFNDLFFCTTGKLDSNAAIKGGRYPFFTCAKEIFYINDYAFDQEALLLAGNNAAGKYDVKYYNGKFNAYQRTYVLSLRKKGIYSIFKKQLEDKLEYLQSQSKGSTTRYLTMGILKKLTFCVPDMEIQLKLDKEIQQINKLKSDVQKSIDETQLLMDSLMQEYFG